MESRFAKLKWAFYQWLGSLSIKEIMNNQDLMESIRRFERLIQKAQA